jgi:hypothetical protein
MYIKHEATRPSRGCRMGEPGSERGEGHWVAKNERSKCPGEGKREKGKRGNGKEDGKKKGTQQPQNKKGLLGGGQQRE